MESTPPVDQVEFDALLELLDRDTMREVVQLFMHSAPERLATARGGLASGDYTAVATAFHTMRSGCGQLGARPLEALCADGERLAKAGDHTAASARLEEAQAEFARCARWFLDHGWVDA
ncbi:MAG: Hpt domain-containing protein [Gemmatimonadaceae bacterium]|nr:Hpt domain-containing protein [Gemmatimonadaceae bacterium]